MRPAESYSWNASSDENGKTVEVTDFNIEGIIKTNLYFGNNPENKAARGGDPFTFYPIWSVQLNLDKFYPGNVYGLDVKVWADTKEIRTIEHMTKFGVS